MKALSFYKEKREEFLEELFSFLKIPTVSTDPSYSSHIQEGAQFLKKTFEKLNLPCEIIPTKGHPLVYAEWIQKENYPTFLIYGHYDVQPPDPLEEWISPPFEPEVREGKIYARGASDDKGQVWIHLASLACMLQSPKDFPINLKFCIEGEEEIGSPHLIPFVKAQKEKLSAEAVLISDTPFVQKGLPTISSGLRGIVYYEIEIQTAKQDLHSGSYGGAVPNPCHLLAEMITKLKTPEGKILIPHFYDQVQPMSEEERESLKKIPFSEEELRKQIGAKKLKGEKGHSLLECLTARPTLDVNGIFGGYTKPGAKTIIPSRATVKISMRLVPNQDPRQIAKSFEEYLREICPSEGELTLRPIETGGKPYVADTSHPLFQKAKQALQKGFHTDKVVFLRQGGSIPFVPIVSETLEAPCLLLGFGLPEDGPHSPNESFDLDQFDQGVATLLHFYHSFCEE